MQNRELRLPMKKPADVKHYKPSQNWKALEGSKSKIPNLL